MQPGNPYPQPAGYPQAAGTYAAAPVFAGAGAYYGYAPSTSTSSNPTGFYPPQQQQQQQMPYNSGVQQGTPNDATQAVHNNMLAAVGALREEMCRALAFSRVDCGEVTLPIRLMGNPCDNVEVVWHTQVNFMQPFAVIPRIVLHMGSQLMAQGSGDHGCAQDQHANIGRLLVKLTATDVTQSGFTLTVATWHRGHIIANSTFAWLASCSPMWWDSHGEEGQDPVITGNKKKGLFGF
jgi:hypothetical protein